MAASSSPSSFSGVDPSLCKYDVFISFRGGDPRHGFTRDLYSTLCGYPIRALIDEDRLENRLEKGDAVSAIEESAISIIVFSTNYASSTWCLDELVEILKCKKEKGQIVLPIFDGLDPSDIRRRKSSYAAALVEHEQRFKNQMDKVQEWGQALTEASNLAGWDSRDMSESELVEEVVRDFFWRLTEIWSTTIDNSDGLLDGAFLSAFVEDLFRRFRSQDFLDLLKGKEQIKKLVKDVNIQLFSANRLLDDAEEKQLTNATVKLWLDLLKEQILRADNLMENINYEVLIRKLGGASESSTSIATFGKSSKEESALKNIPWELFMIISKLLTRNGEARMLGLKVLSLRSHGEPLVLESEDDKEATMLLVLLNNKAMLEAAKKAFKPDVYGGEDAKKADLNAHPDLLPVIGEETGGDLGEVLNAHPDLLPVIGEETGGIGKINLGEFLNAHPDLLPVIGEETGGIGKTNLGEFLNAHPDLQGIGEEIVNKCKGHPIAFKSVVALLCSIPSPDEWRKILENHIWDLKLQENASNYVLPALWLSYRYLSPRLKRCFAYCSIFPKDYEFTQKEVILLWMAEGFLQPKRGTRIEDVGEEYFKILTSRSFFQQSVHDKSKFRMHDCVHDLANFVWGDFLLRLEDDNKHKIPSDTRHLSFMKEYVGDMGYFEGISEASHLRTFLPLESNQPFRDAVPLEELLRKKECLRVLSLSQYPCIAELPSSILESKPLRYLDLSSTSIRNIPDTICTLYNLETLLLSNCKKLTRLPYEIRRLIKLRHLDFAGSGIKELPPQICKLKNLQTLTRFIVCKEHSSIEELGDLQQLHGKFEIFGLENVVDVDNILEAELWEKEFLTSLGLYWDGESCYGTWEASKLLYLLRPHENLKALRIYGFAGERFPDWMGDQSFGNIVEVQLAECKNCKSLPPLGQLPSLKNLQISGFKSVETIGPEFYSNGSSTTKPFGSLEVLRFEDMAIWEEWLFPKDQVFQCLKELVFYECPQLDVWLPADCFPSLTKLLVSHCRQLMPLLIPVAHQRVRFPSLGELEIFACPEQVIFLQGGLPSSLKKIKISRCESLKLLHCKDFQHLTFLERLEIIECKELHRLPEELPTYPFELSIVECPFLQSGGWRTGKIA